MMHLQDSMSCISKKSFHFIFVICIRHLKTKVCFQLQLNLIEDQTHMKDSSKLFVNILVGVEIHVKIENLFFREIALSVIPFIHFKSIVRMTDVENAHIYNNRECVKIRSNDMAAFNLKLA